MRYVAIQPRPIDFESGAIPQDDSFEIGFSFELNRERRRKQPDQARQTHTALFLEIVDVRQFVRNDCAQSLCGDFPPGCIPVEHEHIAKFPSDKVARERETGFQEHVIAMKVVYGYFRSFQLGKGRLSNAVDELVDFREVRFGRIDPKKEQKENRAESNDQAAPEYFAAK